MDKQVFTAHDDMKVILQINGDLRLKGTGEDTLTAKADAPEELVVDQGDSVFVVRCQSNCSVRVPMAAAVQVDYVNGNASLKGLDGNLVIGKIGGNLELKSIGPTQIESVSGNMSVRQVRGDLELTQVSGDVFARDLSDAFIVRGGIAGNLKLDDVDGSVNVNTGGDASLRFEPQPGEEIKVHAGGNIVCRLGEDLSADVQVEARGRLSVRLGGEHNQDEVELPYQATFGDGEARLILSAGGDVLLTGRAPDWEMPEDFDADVNVEFEGMAHEISDQVMRQMEAQMKLLERQLNAQMEHLTGSLSSGHSQEMADKISERARAASARATARTQEKMQRAHERLQRKMEQIERKAEQKARAAEKRAESAARRERRSWGFNWQTPPMPPMPPGAPPGPGSAPGASATEEERLMILKMLADQKITADEAEQLLSALDG